MPWIIVGITFILGTFLGIDAGNSIYESFFNVTIATPIFLLINPLLAIISIGILILIYSLIKSGYKNNSKWLIIIGYIILLFFMFCWLLISVFMELHPPI